MYPNGVSLQDDDECLLKQRAWRLVERMLDMHHSHHPVPDTHGESQSNGRFLLISPMGVDEMMRNAIKFIRKHREFRAAGKMHGVDIGYHYTHHENQASIKEMGLLSRKEQQLRQVQSKTFNGLGLGDGIYLASDPISNHKGFGNFGILAARLRGNSRNDIPISAVPSDCIVTQPGPRREHTVVKQSGQCLPLFGFYVHPPNESPASFSSLEPPHFQELHRLHVEVQEFLDSFFCQDPPTRVPDYNTTDRESLTA